MLDRNRQGSHGQALDKVTRKLLLPRITRRYRVAAQDGAELGRLLDAL